MCIKIDIQRLEDNIFNNYKQSSTLTIKDGRMCYFIHDLGEGTPDGDEIEIWYDFDEYNTQKFLASLDLLGKSDEEIELVLRREFSQRPSGDTFIRRPSEDFSTYAKKLGLESKMGSWC